MVGLPWSIPSDLSPQSATAYPPEGFVDTTVAWTAKARRSEERRVGKECRSLCDWSSDVCSSDLGVAVVHTERLEPAVGDGVPAGGVRGHDGRVDRQGAQIGRASCRERV